MGEIVQSMSAFTFLATIFSLEIKKESHSVSLCSLIILPSVKPLSNCHSHVSESVSILQAEWDCTPDTARAGSFLLFQWKWVSQIYMPNH